MAARNRLRIDAADVISTCTVALALAAIASSAALRYILLAYIVFVVLFLARQWRSVRIASPAVLLIAVFFGLGLLSWRISVVPERSAEQVQRLWVGVLACVILSRTVTTPARIGLVTFTFVAVGALLAIVSPVVVEAAPQNKFSLISPEVFTAFGPAVSDAANPNVLAGSIILMLPFAIVLLISGSKRSHKVFGALTAGFMAAGLLLLQSRGAILAALVAVLCLVIMQRIRPADRRKAVPVMFAVLVAVIALSGAFPVAVAHDSVLTSGISGLAERQSIWRCGWNLAQDFPFTGLGMGAFNEICNYFYPHMLLEPAAPHSHGLLLQILLDLGVLGLCAWLAVLGSVGRACLSAWRRMDRALAAIAAAIFVSQLALLIQGALDAVTWGMVRPAPLVWLLWGVAIGLSRISQSGHAVVVADHSGDPGQRKQEPD